MRSPLPGSIDTRVENIPGNGTLEDETVKEVPLDTPISKPCDLQKPVPKFEEDKSPEVEEGGVPSVSETSQVTEWCSNMSESVSMATTISEQREGDEASSKQSREIGRNTTPKIRRKRPYSGDPSCRREQRCRVSCRNTQGRTESREARTRKKLSGGHEQQSGVGHGRRSRSPAAARTVGGTNKMGGNVKSSAMKGSGRAAGELQEIATTKKREEGDDEIQPPNESIENPLVSLECFIFL
ncbi:uncharacterized protein LOC111437167 [Cucurbita moschata]|uniref:Uncharacterized protein LOC111437167 n=1 Tax=Cucurbita moschata TaxID=3662 RepID=A0A6J1ERM6_CUCMO|nr:uncharacterized protein LOC111437167 [Cucurbita moschata]